MIKNQLDLIQCDKIGAWQSDFEVNAQLRTHIIWDSSDYLIKCQVYIMSCRGNVKLTNSPVNRNVKLMKCQVDEMSS